MRLRRICNHSPNLPYPSCVSSPSHPLFLICPKSVFSKGRLWVEGVKTLSQKEGPLFKGYELKNYGMLKHYNILIILPSKIRPWFCTSPSYWRKSSLA
jgi:hypothetical protein